MDKCPHCGGKNGYYTTGLMKYRRNFDWDGEVWDTSLETKTGGAKRCFDCDKAVGAALHKQQGGDK